MTIPELTDALVELRELRANRQALQEHNTLLALRNRDLERVLRLIPPILDKLESLVDGDPVAGCIHKIRAILTGQVEV